MVDGYSASLFDTQTLRNEWNPNPELNRELLAYCCLPGTPVETLRGCLSLLTRDLLQEMAEDHSLTLKASTTKGKIIDALIERIIAEMPVLLTYLPMTNTEFLSRFKGETSLIIPKEALFFHDISYAQDLGFLYLFDTGETFTAVVPLELAGFLQEIDSPASVAQIEFHQRLDAYALSLVNLYGVLDIDQYASIWNTYEGQSITPAFADDELNVLSRVQYSYWCESELIISSYFETAEDVMEFLGSVRDISYFKPSREDILYYYTHTYDMESVEVSEMEKFISAYPLEENDFSKDVLDDLADVCVADEGLSGALEVLGDYGIVFKGKEDTARFAQLFANLSNHSRKWRLKGYTPLSVPSPASHRKS